MPCADPTEARPAAASFDAVVLAGGTGARMGGEEKAALRLGGRPLLAHALEATSGARQVVVVGDPTDVDQPVRFVREEPALGGPAAALLTGLAALTGPEAPVVVLAVDMPRVTAATLHRLRKAAETDAEADGAVLVDTGGRRQLAMALDPARVRACAPPPGDWSGLPLRRLLAPLRLAEVPAQDDEGRDVDTWSDLHALEQQKQAGRTGSPRPETR